MSEIGHCEGQDLRVTQPPEVSAVLAALQQAGAAQFDPVRWHYLHLLAGRVNAHSGAVQRVLEVRLAQALAAFQARFEQALGDAKFMVEQARRTHPDASADLQRLLAAGDLQGIKRFIVNLKTSDSGASLSDLVRALAQPLAAPADTGFERGCQTVTGLRPDLKATRYFRETWSKISVDKRVTQALTQAPKNAGPINSHNLVLRSLALMRDISPDYLNQFTSYVDTLLCLDQCEKAKQTLAKLVADADSRPKTKPRRARSR